jgi:hypothetical protein
MEWRTGDELTLVAACCDVLRVVSAEEGTKFEDELKPVIEEAEDLSQSLGEVWTDEYPPYQQLERDHRTVVHDERYVSEEGVHANQAECLCSLLEPGIEKFRGLSKHLGTYRSHLWLPAIAESRRGTNLWSY